MAVFGLVWGATEPLDISPDDVRLGVPLGDGIFGNLVLPVVGDVRSGVQYGSNGTEYTGTLVVTGGGGGSIAPSFDLQSANNGRNNLLQFQQPAPKYANDGSGFWTNVLASNKALGVNSLLPQNTLIQADNATKARLLRAQIAWMPTKARWKKANLVVSLLDSQFSMSLEEGGEMQPGRITVMVEKLQLQTTFPENGDVFKIQAAGKWHEFEIVEMVGQNDDNDPGLTLFLEKAQNDIGE